MLKSARTPALALACLACVHRLSGSTPAKRSTDQDFAKRFKRPAQAFAKLLLVFHHADGFSPSIPGLLGRSRRHHDFAMQSSAAAGSAPDSNHSLMGSKGALSNVRVVLASQSPRRREILDLIGLEHEVIVSQFEENLDKTQFQGDGGPARYARTNAVCKAREVAQRCLVESSSPQIFIGADTVVDLDGIILEKPKTTDEAKTMLRRLSGRQHLVHTGVGIFTSRHGTSEPAAEFHETTQVFFGELSDNEIDAYVATGDPMDKAGSYGIQGIGGQFVDRIVGCYFNVMGFPMRRFSTSLFGLLDNL